MAKEDDKVKKLFGKTRKEIEKDFRETLKRMGMLEEMDRAKELDGESRRRRRQLGEPTKRKPKNKPNQQDRNDPTGIDVRDGGAMQKTYGMKEGGFTKRGGMYKKGY
tara:strand:- start:14037 stop:14357 length:321 start_codon:yes stop_codon:yes gene_type:complete